MEVRTRNETHVTIRFSQHEADVMRAVIHYGEAEFINQHRQGAFDGQSKGFITTANKIAAGWSIFPTRNDCR